MACLDMYNNSSSSSSSSSDHKSLHRARAPAASPRISFSSDFVDIQQSLKHQQRSAAAPPPVSSSSDFEFSVSNHSMMPADELFFQGRLLPFKDSNRPPSTTLRDELLVEEDEGDNDNDNDDVSHRPSIARWKGFLGLKKSHNNNASKKASRNDGSSATRNVAVDTKRPFGWSPLSGTRPNSSQGQNEEGSSCKDDEEIDF